MLSPYQRVGDSSMAISSSSVTSWGAGTSGAWHTLMKNFSSLFNLKLFTQIPGRQKEETERNIRVYYQEKASCN